MTMTVTIRSTEIVYPKYVPYFEKGPKLFNSPVWVVAVCVKEDSATIDAVWVGVDIGRGRHVHIEPVGLDVERRRLIHLLQDVAVEEGPVERRVVQVDQRRPVPVPDLAQQPVVDRKLGHHVRSEDEVCFGLGKTVVAVDAAYVVVDLVELVIRQPGERGVAVAQSPHPEDQQEDRRHECFRHVPARGPASVDMHGKMGRSELYSSHRC